MFLCSNCNLNDSVNLYKERLISMIVEKDYNLLDDEVIKLSQFLDELIDKCILCENNLTYNLDVKK